MSELSLSQVFAGATQTATAITIPKSALTGLNAAAENNADSILVAFLNKLVVVYSPTARDGDKDISLVVSLSPIPSIDADFSVTPNLVYTVLNYEIGVYTPFFSSVPDPNNY